MRRAQQEAELALTKGLKVKTSNSGDQPSYSWKSPGELGTLTPADNGAVAGSSSVTIGGSSDMDVVESSMGLKRLTQRNATSSPKLQSSPVSRIRNERDSRGHPSSRPPSSHPSRFLDLGSISPILPFSPPQTSRSVSDGPGRSGLGSLSMLLNTQVKFGSQPMISPLGMPVDCEDCLNSLRRSTSDDALQRNDGQARSRSPSKANRSGRNKNRKLCSFYSPPLSVDDFKFVENIVYGASDNIGQRSNMEDEFAVKANYDDVIKFHMPCLGLPTCANYEHFDNGNDSRRSSLDGEHLCVSFGCQHHKNSVMVSPFHRDRALGTGSRGEGERTVAGSATTCPGIAAASPLSLSNILTSAKNSNSSISTVATMGSSLHCNRCCPDCSNAFSYFAVFDGHGGKTAGQWCRDWLHVNIARYYARNLNEAGYTLSTAMQDGFQTTESDFMRYALEREDESGATCSVCIVRGTTLFIANVGDSKVVLSRAGSSVDLTKDHNCKSMEETLRVEEAGGEVEFGFVGGELEVTRSIGDLRLDTGEKLKGLTCKPDTHVRKLTLFLHCGLATIMWSTLRGCQLIIQHLRCGWIVQLVMLVGDCRTLAREISILPGIFFDRRR